MIKGQANIFQKHVYSSYIPAKKNHEILRKLKQNKFSIQIYIDIKT